MTLIPSKWYHNPETGFVAPLCFAPLPKLLDGTDPVEVVPGLCFEGSVGEFVADPFTGKTLLLLDLALALSHGQSWLKWTPIAPAPVLICALDSPHWDVRKQLRDLSAGRGIVETPDTYAPLFVMTRDTAPKSGIRAKFNLMDDRWYNYLVRTAKDMGARIIGLDSFSSIVNVDENKKELVQPVMDRLETLAAETKAFVLFMHHTPVASRENPNSVYAGRGSGVISASCTFVASLTGLPNRLCKFRVHKGRGSDDTNEDIYLAKSRVEHPTVLRAVKWEVVEKPGKTSKRELVWTWLYTTLGNGLKSREEMEEAALAAGLAKPGQEFVGNYLQRFKKQGLVEQRGRGFWGLTDRGSKLAEEMERADT